MDGRNGGARRQLVSGRSNDYTEKPAQPATSAMPLRPITSISQEKGTPMRDIAKEVYDKMKIGGTAWIRPVTAKGDTMSSFQGALDSAKQLAEEGLINIEKVQRQEDGLIEAIRILRLS
ncbi:MAG: hypothetical protein V4578_16685 [Pseudomonadota bacterium]